ncbi:hypothetical protein EDB92DRAFT_1151369 [Lactarius akahatsu]|uniref:Secreted protein n=1 Tax=Lactarius akahatsu TaxID=416441 RepID=A0AAD4QBA8_9AGAM|nr:hypothetical protein EDB92DRAFT_1151369 [Lactarius akahatsu]
MLERLWPYRATGRHLALLVLVSFHPLFQSSPSSQIPRTIICSPSQRSHLTEPSMFTGDHSPMFTKLPHHVFSLPHCLGTTTMCRPSPSIKFRFNTCVRPHCDTL